MNDRVMEQEEVMNLVSDVLDSAIDTKSARAGLVNLMNNPAYNISSHLKNVFLHIASSDEAFEKFKTEINSSMIEDVKEPVVIPETSQNVFFDKLMSRRVHRARLLDDSVIIPYDVNNKQLIYALMDNSVVNKFGFILANVNDKASFVFASANKNIDSEQFYHSMNNLVDHIDANRDYLQNADAEIVKIAYLFDSAVSNNTGFNIGLTPRENGKEIIISFEDSSYIDKFRGSGMTISDNKIRISNDFLNNLSKVEAGLSNNVNTTDSVNYSLYDSKKVDGTDVKTELYEETSGNSVYMSTNISNVDAQVDVKRDYYFTSKDNFGVFKSTFLSEEELIERKNGSIKEKDNGSLSCVFALDDGKVSSWGEGASVDNYGEVTTLYSQLESLPRLKDSQAMDNSQSVSKSGQVLVKSNPNLPPTLPSQEKNIGINNSGFSSTFLFVTLLALEMMAIAFGIFMFVK